MRDRRDPWKWPFALGLALALTLGLFLLVPVGWLASLFPDPGRGAGGQAARPARWITVLPPVEIVARPDSRPDPPPPRREPPPSPGDPRWWDEAWRVRTEVRVVRDLRPAATADDSVAVLLEQLGVGIDFLRTVRPDSLLAARLTLLQVEDSFRFDELKPYFSAVTRSRAYADILSRAADMYDDHLQSQIMVPD